MGGCTAAYPHFLRKEIIMADYYTRFSLILPLPDEATQKYALDLVTQATGAQQDDTPPDNFPPALAEAIKDWCFETDAESRDGKWGVWLHSDNGGIDAVCAFLQYLLEKFDPQARVAFEWSHDCNKPRIDAFGGGAALVTAKEIKTMNTADWLSQQAA
jgi:hypothetical protein